MRVLFIPMREGWLAHLIPLVALNKMLEGTSVKTAFLVPRTIHGLLKQAGLEVVDVDYDGFRSELRALGLFSPDVVVDDASLITGYTTALSGVPRVPIQRTGMFPGGEPRNKNHWHSIGIFDLKHMPDVTSLGLQQPKCFTDLFAGALKIVPGIRSIEVLPPQLQADPTYYYSGPLIMDDYLMQDLGQPKSNRVGLNNLRDFSPLEKFFEANKDRKIIYATFGTMARPGAIVFECLRYLLDKGIAVVTSIKFEGLAPAQRELCYMANYLPMHFVCSKVDLMIHHCGSGTYHYPILHGVPTITIGTRCYDRDDVAVRLEELGVSVHLPAPEENPDFIQSFKSAIERYIDESGAFIEEKKQNIAKLNAEIEQTSSEFNFLHVLEQAVKVHKMARAR